MRGGDFLGSPTPPVLEFPEQLLMTVPCLIWIPVFRAKLFFIFLWREGGKLKAATLSWLEDVPLQTGFYVLVNKPL